jgi:hypothetical protein
MSRWPVLTVFSFGWTLLGCSPSLQPGLANAPRLGGTGLADERIRDVIANGDDACSRQAEQGPLRNRVPPCPTAARPVAGGQLPQPTGNGSLVLPWLRHFYNGWPCAHPAFLPAAETKAVEWTVVATTPTQPVASCAVH